MKIYPGIPYRQGDVGIRKIDKLPDKAKLKKDNIILRGEATGHAHRVQNGLLYEAEIEPEDFLSRPEKRMFIVARKGTRVVHEEHGPIDIEIGIYIIVRQREHDGKETRWIAD